MSSSPSRFSKHMNVYSSSVHLTSSARLCAWLQVPAGPRPSCIMLYYSHIVQPVAAGETGCLGWREHDSSATVTCPEESPMGICLSASLKCLTKLPALPTMLQRYTFLECVTCCKISLVGIRGRAESLSTQPWLS